MTSKKQITITKAALIAVLIAAALIVILSVSALILSLSPAKETPSTPSTNPGTRTEAETLPSVTPNESLSDVSAYQALINYLQEEILNLKQEAYVSRVEYEARVESLNQALRDALANAGSPSGTDVSVSVTPTDPEDDGTSVFGYSVTDGQVTIHTYTGSSLHVTVPASIGGYPVTHMDDGAFRSSAVKTVVLPDTLESIGWFAFADTPSLTSVTIPASVTTIGYGAFENTPSLTLVVSEDSYAQAYAQSFAIPCTARGS